MQHSVSKCFSPFDVWPGIEQFQLRELGRKVLGLGAGIYCLGKAIMEG